MKHFYEYGTLEEMQAASWAEDMARLKAAQVEYQSTLSPLQKITEGLKSLEGKMRNLNQLSPEELEAKRIAAETAIEKTKAGLLSLTETQKQNDIEKMEGVGDFFKHRADCNSILRS